jgi:peptide-methionine (S)-S-oxide reductase
MNEKPTTTILAAGCFWCLEAVYLQLKGVVEVVSGYAGGEVVNPNYREVCNGTTGHAEAVRITFDPEVISFTELLEVFWRTHDPTTRNRQGGDIGTQYRAAVFYHDEEQRELAEQSKRRFEETGLWSDPIVTEIVPFTNFYPAEEYHRDYYRQNSYQTYCRVVIDPKLRRLQKEFADKLKKPEA